MPDTDLPPSTPAGQGAWVSAVFKNTNNSRSFMHYPASPDGKVVVSRESADLQKRMERGEPLEIGDIPRERFHRNKWQYAESLPPVILTGYLALHRDVAAIFARFDLGGGRLHPIDLIEHDRTTLISSDYAILTPGNAFEAFDLERSTGVKRIAFMDKVHHVVEVAGAKDRPVYVLQPGFSCAPDVWVDPRVMSSLFLSDRLVDALKAAKFEKFFSLTRCLPS
ncbi:MAG TPA: hypothetical protein PKD10_02900 [Paracoccaceae bacterium]|nr:hypothetical protein [Paracoccaceae bacterium]